MDPVVECSISGGVVEDLAWHDLPCGISIDPSFTEVCGVSDDRELFIDVISVCGFENDRSVVCGRGCLLVFEPEFEGLSLSVWNFQSSQ